MKTKINKYKDLPFEEGKTYKTKFQSGELFHLKEITYKDQIVNGKKESRIISLRGIYENTPHLGICHIGTDRLIPDSIFDTELTVCSKCNEPI